MNGDGIRCFNIDCDVYGSEISKLGPLIPGKSDINNYKEFTISGFQVVLPNLIEPLNIPPGSETWPASVLTLVIGAFLFPMGRVVDMFGGYLIFNGGLVWFVCWTLVAGFSQNFATLVVCRAMEGLGAAAFLPAGISILGRIYRPGPRKNFVFSLYGALAPLCFFFGILFGGITFDLLNWRWYFWLGSMLSAVCCFGTMLTTPRDYHQARKMNVKMDWWGSATLVPGSMLLVFAITESSHASKGWASPSIIVTFVLGCMFLAAAFYVEGYVATHPLIPFDILQVNYMKPMLLTLFITWGVFSIYLFYANFYIQIVVGESPLVTAFYFTPWAVGGLILAMTSGLILHCLSGRVLMIISGVAKMLAVLLFAVMPERPSYWAWIFPAMLAETACCDVLWTVSNVFLTTSVPKHRQGLAGALININLFLGGAFFLGIADMAVGEFKKVGMNTKQQYKGAFWIGVGFATIALFICFHMKLGKAGCAMTADEKLAALADDDTMIGSQKSGSENGYATEEVVSACAITETAYWVREVATEVSMVDGVEGPVVKRETTIVVSEFNPDEKKDYAANDQDA